MVVRKRPSASTRRKLSSLDVRGSKVPMRLTIDGRVYSLYEDDKSPFASFYTRGKALKLAKMLRSKGYYVRSVYGGSRSKWLGDPGMLLYVRRK